MKLFEAIEANDLEAAARAIKRVKNINAEMRGNGYTPLGYAAKHNADRVIPVILNVGAKPEPGETLHPLYLAATEGSDEAMAVLLDARTWEPEPVVDALRGAAIQGKTEALRLLMDKTGALPIPLALCAVAMTGRLEAMKLLLERGGDPEALDDGTAALHVAARAGYPELIKMILDRGADVNLRDAKGRTPLMHATLEHSSHRYERVNHRQRLRDLADPNSGVKILSGSLAEPPHGRRTIETLFNAGADPTLTENNGHTGLDILVQEGRRLDKWLQKRLETAGAPQVDKWPIHLAKAISDKCVDDVRDLLSHGRNVNFTTARGFSMLCHACRIGHEAIVRLLLDAGADPNRPDEHEIPLHSAVVGKNVEVVRMLLDTGADPNLPDPGEEHFIPLQLAKSLGYREIAELLMECDSKMPEPKYKAVEPGVHWWDDWEFVVVKADVKTIAGVLDPTGDSIDLDPLDKTFLSGGRGTFVIAQPKGLTWSNVLRASPIWRNMEDDFKEVAQKLAKACKTQAIHATFSDCAGAASVVYYESDGSIRFEDRGADLEFAEMAVSFAEDENREPPEWALQMIDLAEETGEIPPGSTERLESLARAEGFALGWAYFGVQTGENFEVEFTDDSAEAFEAVAFVDAPSWA